MHRGSSSLSISTTEAEEVARAEAAAVIEDLKARLEKLDSTSEQYRKQADVLQSRLQDALKEQAKLEERAHEGEEQLEALRNEKRESARQMREMETIYEAEKSKILKEKEDMSNREEEMQAVINRLKDTLNQRNATEDDYRPSRQCESPLHLRATVLHTNSISSEQLLSHSGWWQLCSAVFHQPQ